MEKNKGLFSFRKHPIGNFLDEKKGRKRKGGRLRRSMGFLMVAALIFNTLPASGLAVSASEQEKGLCEHHRSHTPECGYAEEKSCTHEHGEECYKTVTECVHEHTDECYPETEATEESTGEGSATTSDAGNRELSLCTHVCSEESGCITKVLDCHHEHDESCGYQEAQDCGYVCEICNGTEPEDTEDTGTDTAKCICETLCTEDSINGDCPVCGAGGDSLLDCKGKVSEENMGEQEDTGICKHHQEHDDACGYQPASENGEGSLCTYECHICPIEDLIAALPDTVTEDNADDVRAQLEEILALYRELTEDEQGQIDLSRCYELQEALDNANAPVQAAEEITINNATVKTLTAEDGDCPGHTFTGTAQRTTIYVASGVHNVTFSNLSITGSANVGIAPGATMNLTIEGTNTIRANNFAGIYVPADAALVIQGAGSLDVSGGGSAGIGGAVYAPDEYSSSGDPNCGTVVINGGTITATGDSHCAGIGGGVNDFNAGNGGNVTINGGTVTATGGSDGSYGGAGIGGAGGVSNEWYKLVSGSGGTLTINGGNVTLKAGQYGSQYPAYGFGQGSGSAPAGGTCELTLADASCLTLAEGTTLDPKGTYTINGDPTADMIVVPEGLVYTGQALDVSGIKIDDTKTGTGTYFNQTFTVNASADGWVLQDLGEVVNAGTYTATFKKGDKEISKTFTVAQSGTQFVGDGEVKTYNGSEETTSFSADDTIKVVAAPTPTGATPTNSAMFAASFTEPGAGQMAVFVNDTQVSEPVDAGADGSYTMTISAADVLLAAGGPGTEIPLTAKFVGNDNMADGAGTVKVNITAVAKAEKGGAVIGYYGESNLASAFTNAGATITLLDNITTSTHIEVKDTENLTLDLNGKTITKPTSYAFLLLGSSHLTIRGNGKVICTGTSGYYPEAITLRGGALTLEDGTFIGLMNGVFVEGETSVLSVTGESVSIQGEGRGLRVGSAQSVQLSAGTYSNISVSDISVGSSHTLASLLAENCAYYRGSTPVLLSELEGKTELTGPVTVKVCDHTGDGVCEYTPNENDANTHTKTCLACGYTETGNCGFEKTADPTADNHTGQCPYCKRDRSDAHSFSEWSGDPVARVCTVCGYEQIAVAKVEKSNSGGTEYMTAKGLNTVFASNSDYEGATVTLLDDMTITDAGNRPRINIRCTLNLNGHTIRSDAVGAPPLEVSVYGNVTITGSGEIVSNSNPALYVVGTAVLEGGIFRSGRTHHGAVEVMNGSLSVTGENVVMENTGSGNGLLIYSLESVKLSAGKYSGAAGAISVSTDAFTLSSLLNQEGTSRVAYYQDNATLVTEGLDGQALPSGSYTVKVCTHAGEGICTYAHIENTSTHTKTCLACGKTWAAENCAYTFSGATGTCAACGDSVTVAVSGAENLIYDGTEKEPGVTVTRGETALTAGTDYTVAYTDNKNAGENKATVTVTIGNGQGSYTENFTIGKATLYVRPMAQTITYGGSIAQGLGQVTPTGLCTGDTLESVTLTPSTRDVPGGNIIASEARILNDSGEDMTANYNITYQPGTLTISYMDAPGLQYNDSDKKDYYNRDVAVKAVSADGHTYTVSDTLGGDYKPSYTISAQEGTVTKTLYFKDEAGHMSDGVEVTVKFDLTPPMGEIAVGMKWWQNVLNFVSFGNYAAKEYTVTIKAEDKNGSGISRIEYVIVTGSSQYTDVGALTSAVQESEWKEYDSSNRPTVSANTSQYVVYARLTDNVGNATYISTDGILLDSTAPTVGGLAVPEETKKDVTVGVTFTVSETADYYYVVLPKDSTDPSAEDIIVTCGGTLPEGTGTAIAGTVSKGSGAVSADTPGVSVEAENLSPNTAYMVYVTAVDRAVDITNSAEGKPAGNIADAVNTGFTTKKTLPVITKAPAVTGTYGQSVGEMTITGGRAQAGSTVLAGTWAVSDADKNEKPSAGTAEVTVIFTPGNANYDSVPVQASLTVSPRNLNEAGVTVSEVEGTYTYTGSEIKPPVAVGTGTPTSGIYISDSGAVLNANDFTVSYSNNKDAGTASVTITGKGNYTGSVARTFTIEKAPGREVPDVSGSHTDNGQTYTYTVTPMEGAVYRMDNGAWQAENIFKDIKPGTSVTFYAMMPEDKNYEEGMPKYITVNFPKLTPAAPALTYKADRTNPADVKVAITPVSGAEYSFDGGKTWIESNEQGGFTTSQTVTLAIRLKETDTHNQSPVRTMTVNLAKEDREAPPAFSLKVEANGETDYTVTIPATEGCEYSFDGEHWSDVNVKTGVSVGETVTGYKRYKETNDYNASSAVSAKETMPKFTVKTPVISPAGGSCSGNISVTITCGSTDAEIYYTTDGSTPGRSSTRYTGAFTVSAPATVKAVAIKDGLNDSAVATASYTKKDGGGSGGGNSGGNSGGSENNGGSGGNDEGQGSGGGGSTNPGNGNTTPLPSVTQPTDTNTNPGNETIPGTGTTPVNPGSGNTVKPGTAPGSGNAGTPAQGTKQPFIKGADGKIGWDVIRAEEEQAQEGSTINVDMNGSVVVPGDIFDSIKGKDITITFDMGNGILWSVDGKSIITDKAGDIDFSVKKETNAIPVDIVNNVTGENYSIQISLAYEGEFGFTAVLSIGLGKENAGYTASLYYYNESTGELEFICSDEVAEDGTVSLAFTHASDYVIAIDGEEESGNATEPEQPDTPDKDSTGQAEESPQAGQAWRPWWLIVVGALVIIMGIGVFFAVKKGKDGDSGQ